MPKDIQFILYNFPEKEGKVQVIIRDETLWCTQKAMAQLFGVDRTVVSKHLKNIFESAELQQDSVCAKFAHTAEDGKIYNTQFYNLDAVISVGYRVNSLQATRFRQWTTKILNEYIKKGFVLNDDRLKQGETVFGQDYFQELLERIRSIRASERRIWQKITDIYAECSIDYDKDSPTTHDFYAMIQNRFHYAITGQTAAEIVYHNADHTKEHMGLTSWKNAPNGKIVKADVSVAKNYLLQDEMQELNEIVTMYLDYATRQARRHIPMTMEDWASKLDAFLQFNDAEILQDKGKVTAAIAKAFAESEFEKYRVIQDKNYQSDFDRLMAETDETKHPN